MRVAPGLIVSSTNGTIGPERCASAPRIARNVSPSAEIATTSTSRSARSAGSILPSIAAIGNPCRPAATARPCASGATASTALPAASAWIACAKRRLPIRPQAHRAAARGVPQRVCFAGRSRQVHRAEAERRRGCDGVRAPRPRRADIAGAPQCDPIASTSHRASCRACGGRVPTPPRSGLRRARRPLPDLCETSADSAVRRLWGRCPKAPRRRTAANRPPRRSGCG